MEQAARAIQVYLLLTYFGQAVALLIHLLVLHSSLTGWLKGARIEEHFDWKLASLLVLYWMLSPVLFPRWLYSFVKCNWGRNRS